MSEAYGWYPHTGPQFEFCSRGEFECLFGGSAGPGKTDCLIAEAARYVCFPGYRGILLRRTFPQLQEIIDRCFDKYQKIGGEYRATEHRWHWSNGATVKLGHMQHENDKYNYQGSEYHFAGFDELTQFTESQYLYLHSRIRTTDSSIPTQVRSTTNPGGIGHNWVKKRFIDVANPGETYIDPATGQSRCFIPATVHDNPTLMERDPLYIKRLEALPEVEKMRLLYGVWDVFEGQVFTELNQHTHGCEPFPIPPEWEKIMVFDWGYARPWCALWFAVDFNGIIYLYREKYGMVDDDPDKGARQTNTEICRIIHDIERERINMRIADPACWGPTKVKGSNQVLGPSFVEDAGKEGLFFLKADNDRIRGKQQVHQRLKIDDDGDPQFVAFKDCKRWWAEIEALRQDPKNPEDVDSDQPDEGYDCTRYVFMSRPVTPKRQITSPQGTFSQERRRLVAAKQYAIRHGVSLAVAYTRVR